VSNDILDKFARGVQPEAVVVEPDLTPDIFSKYDREPQARKEKVRSTPITVRAEPRPPISGFDQNSPEVAALQARPSAVPEGGGFKKDIKEIGRGIVETPGNIARGTLENISAGSQLVQSGFSDLRSGNIAPGFPSSDPQTWEAGGLLKTVGGALAVPMAPFAATTNRLINQPVTELTGNPNIGARAEFAVGAMGPSIIAGKTVAGKLPANQSINKLVEHIGPENVSEVVNRLQNNPRLRLVDVAPVVGTTAQGLIDPTLPVAQRALTTSVKNSIKGAAPSVEEAFNETMGARPGVVKLLDELKKKATDAGTDIINPAVKGAKPVDTSGVISHIDEILKPAVAGLKIGETNIAPSALQERLARIRQQLTDDKSALTDPAKLHKIQSDLRSEAYNLSTSASGAERTLGKQLYDVRNKIVDAIDEAASGAYKPGLERYRDAKQVEEAFDKGANFNKQSTGAKGVREDHPEIYAKELGAMSPEELTAHKLGARLAIDQTMNAYKFGARRGTDIGEVPFKRDKLEFLFGKNEADRLFQKLQDERDIASTNSRILQGSKTAETKAAQESMKPREIKPLDVKPSLAALLPAAMAEYGSTMAGLPTGVGGALAVGAGVTGGIVRKAAQVARNRLDIGTNNSYAKLASGSDVTRADLINQLLAHPDVVRVQQAGGGNKLLDTARTLGRSISP
jgi:hypothetical protein